MSRFFMDPAAAESQVRLIQELNAMHRDGTMAALGEAAQQTRVTDKVAHYIHTVGQLKMLCPTLSGAEQQTYREGIDHLDRLATRIIEETPDLAHLSEVSVALIGLVADALQMDKTVVVARAIANKVKEIQPLLEQDGAWMQWISSAESQGELPPGMRFYLQLLEQLDAALAQPELRLPRDIQDIQTKAKDSLLQFQIIQLQHAALQMKALTPEQIKGLSREELLSKLPKLEVYLKTYAQVMIQYSQQMERRNYYPDSVVRRLDDLSQVVRSFIVPYVSDAMKNCVEQVKGGEPAAVETYIALLKVSMEGGRLFSSEISEANKILSHLLSEKSTDVQTKRAIIAAFGQQANGLLRGIKETVDPLQKEWHLNFALMYDAFQQTSDPKVRSIITAAAVHYLAKAAPHPIQPLNFPSISTSSMQVSRGSTSGVYHRATREIPEGSEIEQEFQFRVLPTRFGFIPGAKFCLTQSPQIAPLISLSMSVITPSDFSTADGCKQFKESIKHVIQTRYKDRYPREIDPKPIFDLTPMLGRAIVTGGDPARHKLFQEELQTSLKRLDELVREAITEYTTDTEIRSSLTLELTRAGAMICAPFQETGIVFTFPTRSDGRFNPIDEAIIRTGCRLGAVASRTLIADTIDLVQYWAESGRLAQPQDERLLGRPAYTASTEPVQYAVPVGPKADKSPLLFKSPCDLMKTALFQRSVEKFAKEDSPHIFALGHGTLAVLCGFLTDLSKEDWERANEQPELRLILQTTMTRLLHHLATAENHANDFTKFSHAMELVHAEMATLLLVMEHRPEPFPEIYQKKLIETGTVPAGLQKFLETGLAPNAMSVIAELVVRSQPSDRELRVAYNPYAYYETVSLFNGDKGKSKARKIAEVLEGTDYVDLYTAAFHPVASRIPPESGVYAPPDVTGDVRTLLSRSPEGHTLTVAIDNTIDNLYSQDLQDFLKEFEADISAGRLKVVAYRSGQKYDMLGTDQYYGAPFFVISNQPDWKPLTNANLQTDPLSRQWFSLAHRFATRELATYRKAIFANVRDVLDHIPAKLSTKTKPFVIQIDKSLVPGYIQIVTDKPQENGKLMAILIKKFKEAGKDLTARASFGFNQTNWSQVGDTFRITPGTDPRDAALILDALQEFASQSSG